MHAHTPPFTKPEAAYDSRRLYEETSAIAAAQDAVRPPKRARVMPLVVADLQKRIAKGSKEYGEPLTTNNGRDALWDAYEEALDLCLYLRQAIEELRQESVSSVLPERNEGCTCPSGDGSLRWPCPAHMADGTKELAPKWSPQWLAEQGTAATSPYLASFRPNGAQGVNASQLGEFLRNEELKGLGIGDVDPATLRPFEWDEVGGTFARTVARHPANAEALRMADERTPEDRL